MLNNDRLLVQILLLVLLGACLWVLAPFASALFWAAVLAFASWPLMRLLTRQLNGNASLAAGLLTFCWMVLVAVPLVWLGFNIADQIREANALLHNLQVDGLPAPPTWLGELPLIGDSLVTLWSTVHEQGTALLASARPYIGQVGNWLLVRSARIGGGMLELALSLVLVFFFYRDGPRLAAFVHSLLDRLIGGERADHYLELVAGTVQRVVNGVIGTAAAQAVLAYVGFSIAGVPAALVLGLLTFAFSFVMVPPLGLGAGGRLAGMAGRLRHGSVSRCLGHVHHQRGGQHPQTLSDQPRRQPAAGGGAARRVRRGTGVRFHGAVPRADTAGRGLQPAGRLADQGSPAHRREGQHRRADRQAAVLVVGGRRYSSSS